MTNGTEKYIESVKYLSSLYDFLNGQFFNGTLDKPVITIQQDASNKAFGWFSVKKVFFGAYESKSGCAVSKYPVLSDNGLNHSSEFCGGIEEKSCAELISGYFRGKRGKTR